MQQSEGVLVFIFINRTLQAQLGNESPLFALGARGSGGVVPFLASPSLPFPCCVTSYAAVAMTLPSVLRCSSGSRTRWGNFATTCSVK